MTRSFLIVCALLFVYSAAFHARGSRLVAGGKTFVCN